MTAECVCVCVSVRERERESVLGVDGGLESKKKQFKKKTDFRKS